jgi:hypothetical protein
MPGIDAVGRYEEIIGAFDAHLHEMALGDVPHKDRAQVTNTIATYERCCDKFSDTDACIGIWTCQYLYAIDTQISSAQKMAESRARRSR